MYHPLFLDGAVNCGTIYGRYAIVAWLLITVPTQLDLVFRHGLLYSSSLSLVS
ncbi:MAG: hypothetical protein AAF490_07885 [Chloroflexota bacterium]